MYADPARTTIRDNPNADARAHRRGRCESRENGAVTADVSDVILRDGSTLRLRAPRREDEPELVQFFGALSERSLYLRFHGFPSLGPELVEQLLEPDWVERGVRTEFEVSPWNDKGPPRRHSQLPARGRRSRSSRPH